MKRTIKIISPLVVGLFLSLGTATSASSATVLEEFFGYRQVSQDQNVIHGFLDRIGSSMIVVDGYSYRITPEVKVVDKEGNAVPDGIKALQPQSEVNLYVDGRLVLQIQVVSVPR